MTMEQIITELYSGKWSADDLEALDMVYKNLIEEDRKRRYQQRVGN